jgi:DMSO/TMAO reductase YedYZ molybdopterin-dependent catalytic subunit
VWSRRSLLQHGASGAGLVLAGLPGCDRLVLPESAEALEPVLSNADFFVTSCCGTPQVDRASWRLSVVDRTSGQAAVRAEVDLATLLDLPARQKEHTLQCIGSGPSNQAIGNAVWTGLPLPELLALLGVDVPPGALWLKMTGADDYADAVPIEDLDRPMWLVWGMNGELLPEDHGTTVRILAPGRYGIKNPKWLVELAFIDEPFTGYWEERGWSDDATYRANALIVAPAQGGLVEAGPARILGTAFAGGQDIATVEVSLDGGQTWTPAELTYQNGPDVWTLWSFDWQATEGEWTIQARATTEGGEQSAADPDGTDRLGGYDGSMQITVTVLS